VYATELQPGSRRSTQSTPCSTRHGPFDLDVLKPCLIYRSASGLMVYEESRHVSNKGTFETRIERTRSFPLPWPF
jgi:hypothetical protein